MSDRPLLHPNLNRPLVDALSMAATFTSSVLILQRLPCVGLDISWTGTPVGTFDIEISNTYAQAPDGTVTSAGNWTILPTASFSGTYPVPSGSASNGYLDIFGVSAYALRITYNRTSSTGTLTVIPCGKVW